VKDTIDEETFIDKISEKWNKASERKISWRIKKRTNRFSIAFEINEMRQTSYFYDFDQRLRPTHIKTSLPSDFYFT